jgi:hypothetical protein
LISLTSDPLGHQASHFEFKKRRVLLPAKGEKGELKLLYDTGTSAYQLITDPSTWEKLRRKDAEVLEELGNSWGKKLQVFSAPANSSLLLDHTTLNLTKVTYIEGTSGIQNLLMRFSGMNGMIGNQLFEGHVLRLDARNEKFQLD